MKIFEVKIVNYRQYKGDNSIVLSTDSVKNITVVEGNNGEGKSNFMNAVTWCLYGDEMFKSKMNKGRPIINESASFELKPGEYTFVSVAVELGDTKPEYRFLRQIKYTMDGGKPRPDPATFTCKHITELKGYEDISDPEWVINRRFIPDDLKGFFFFDGEKMDEYFEDTTKIKSNVEKIAQIDTLDGVIKTLNSLKTEIGNEMDKFNPDKNEVPPDMEAQQEIYETASKAKDTIDCKIEEDESKICQIDEYLKKNSSEIVRELTNSRSSYERQQSQDTSLLDGAKDNQKILIAEMIPIVFSFGALAYAHEQIEEGTKKGVLPPNIKDVFVKELLEKGVCICGRSLEEDSESRAHVQMLLSSIVPNGVASDSITGKFVISGLLDKVDFTKKFGEERQKIRNLEDSLDTISGKLQSISDQLNAYDEFEIKEQEEERSRLGTEIKQLSVRKGAEGNKALQAKQNLEAYDHLLSQISSSNEKFNQLKTLMEYVKTLISVMADIKDSIVDDVRVQLEEKTREYFFNMIWKREAFSDVQIIDETYRYRISVKSEFGQECLGDLSAGERQVLALSFTAALYSVSGYSVPVFIDTPLGRISEKPRENIAEYLPEYLSQTQLIMLPTDTEYTDVVRNKLKRSVGAEYKIEHDDVNKVSKVIRYG